MSSCRAEHTFSVNKWACSMNSISVWAMMQHVSSGSAYFIQLFPRKMQNRVSTLWGHPSFLIHTKGDICRQRWWRVNGETETELIYSCCKTQRNLSNKGKEGKSRRTWNRTWVVCWLPQPIMHTFTTPHQHGKCFTMFSCDVSVNNRWWKTVNVWNWLEQRGVGRSLCDLKTVRNE